MFWSTPSRSSIHNVYIMSRRCKPRWTGTETRRSRKACGVSHFFACRSHNRSLEWRRRQLKSLHRMVEENEEAIVSALQKDLSRGRVMSLAGEVWDVTAQVGGFSCPSLERDQVQKRSHVDARRCGGVDQPKFVCAAVLTDRVSVIIGAGVMCCRYCCCHSVVAAAVAVVTLSEDRVGGNKSFCFERCHKPPFSNFRFQSFKYQGWKQMQRSSPLGRLPSF